MFEILTGEHEEQFDIIPNIAMYFHWHTEYSPWHFHFHIQWFNYYIELRIGKDYD